MARVPEQVGQGKTFPWGIASLTLALFMLILTCAFLAYARSFGGQGEPARIASWVFVGAISLSGLAGSGAGIAAILQRGSTRTLGIAGLILSGALLVGACIFVAVVLGLAAAVLATI
jgi:hypothetical protein